MNGKLHGYRMQFPKTQMPPHNVSSPILNLEIEQIIRPIPRAERD